MGDSDFIFSGMKPCVRCSKEFEYLGGIRICVDCESEARKVEIEAENKRAFHAANRKERLAEMFATAIRAWGGGSDRVELDFLVNGYAASLDSRKLSMSHITRSQSCLNRTIGECGWRQLTDIDIEQYDRWVVSLEISKRTEQHYREILNAFLKWVANQSRGESRPDRVSLKAARPNVTVQSARSVLPLRLKKSVTLDELIARYISHLVGSGRNDDHIRKTKGQLQRTFRDLEWEWIHQIQSSAFTNWLDGGSLAPSTKKHYRASLQGFCEWAVLAGILKADPFSWSDRSGPKGPESEDAKMPWAAAQSDLAQRDSSLAFRLGRWLRRR